MSKILKSKQIPNTSVVVPDLNLESAEFFQSLFEITIEDLHKKDTEDKTKKEGFEKGYKEGINKGYLEGYKKGYKEGFEKGKKEAEERYKNLEITLKKDFQEKIKSIETFLKNLEEETKKLILNIDREVLELALGIAEKITLKEIKLDPEIPLRIIKEALNYVAEGVTITVKVNPEEYKFLEENVLKYISPPQKINLIPDESVTKGGVFIETSLGIIDATLEKRWKKLLESLFKNED